MIGYMSQLKCCRELDTNSKQVVHRHFKKVPFRKQNESFIPILIFLNKKKYKYSRLL